MKKIMIIIVALFGVVVNVEAKKPITVRFDYVDVDSVYVDSICIKLTYPYSSDDDLSGLKTGISKYKSEIYKIIKRMANYRDENELRNAKILVTGGIYGGMLIIKVNGCAKKWNYGEYGL